MIKWTIYGWIFLLPFQVMGQVFSVSDNYVHEALAINPAYSGSKGALDITLFYRSNTDAFEGSPKTTSFSIHAPLDNERVGLGFLVMNDQYGITGETCMTGNYAYRMNLGYGRLAMGFGAGVSIIRSRWDDLAVTDENDELLSGRSTANVLPDFSLGLYYSTPKYFAGISAPLFLTYYYDQKPDKYVIKNDFLLSNYFIHTGYLFSISRNTAIYPSILFKANKKDFQADFNTMFILMNKFRVGATYRSPDIFAGNLQVQLNDQLRIGYSYDFITGKNLRGMNAHEIMLDYCFDYDEVVPGPRMF